MNSEIIRRLEESLASEDRLGGPGASEILEVVGAAMKSAGEKAGFLATHKPTKNGAWLAIPYAYHQAAQAAKWILDAHRPPGEIVTPKWEIAEVVGGDPKETAAFIQRLFTDLGPLDAEKTLRDRAAAKGD